jgi:hypothetical protein
MANASFLQASFLGGIWSPSIQGNMDMEAYKKAMAQSQNYLPIEEGALTRRPGTRFLGPTRNGAPGRVIAFDFSVVQPYLMEVTAGWLRLYAGFSLVTVNPAVIIGISTANPAVITTGTAHGLTTGNSITITLNNVPCSAPALLNRQFIITVINDYQYSIADAITGANVNGSALNYLQNTSSTPDTAQQIFELETPYTLDDLPDLRAVVNYNSVLILHEGHEPLVLMQDTANNLPFQLVDWTMQDGPYLDLNPTWNQNGSSGTTLAPSATTGSVTITASDISGINIDAEGNSQGFLSTDVGRLIRIQSGPPVWSNSTTYAISNVVTGSDGNVYQSLTSNNLNNNPVSDGGVNWEIGTTGITWIWLVITAVTSTTEVTATISGDNTTFQNTDATPVWQLGLYSDTTGWPTAGVYNEGRLWLTNSLIGNRLDSGTSNNVDVVTNVTPISPAIFNFSPTGSDGTVADDNGISAIANATDVNAIFWLASNEQGLVLGTQAGEWLVRASQLGDPITPTSIQMHRFSQYGCADIEPVYAGRELIFVQRQLRKLMELGYYPYGEVQGWYAPNMSKFAENLTAPGIAEIRWQFDIAPVLWVRTQDNVLKGITYKHAPSSGMGTADTFVAWHGPHPLGTNRAVESISSGPLSWTADGLSNSLFMVTNNTNVSDFDYNVRFVEVLSPLFDDALQANEAYFVDGGGTPGCGVITETSNVATGLKLYGFYYSQGNSMAVVLGGLDLGDYVVASDGSITLTFGQVGAHTLTPGSQFTYAYLQSFAGQEYGIFQVSPSFAVTNGTPQPPPFGVNNLAALVGSNDATLSGACNLAPNLDTVNSIMYGVRGGSDASCSTAATGGGIRKFSLDGGHATEGTELLHNNVSNIFTSFAAYNNSTHYVAGNIVTYTDGNSYISNTSQNGVAPNCSSVSWTNVAILSSTSWYGLDGNLYIMRNGPTEPGTISQIRTDTLKETASYNFPTTEYVTTPGQMISGGFINNDTLFHVLLVGQKNAIFAISTDNNDMALIGSPITVAQNEVSLVSANIYNAEGDSPGGTAWAVGKDNYGSGATTTPLGIYLLSFGIGGIAATSMGTIAPSAIDPTWTHFSLVSGPAYDPNDGNIMLHVATTDSVTNTSYFVKINPETATVVYAIAPNALGQSMLLSDTNWAQMKVSNGVIGIFNTGTPRTAIMIQTTAGTTSTISMNSGITGGAANQIYYENHQSIIEYGSAGSFSGSPAVTLQGYYFVTESNTSASNEYIEIFVGQQHQYAPPSYTSYPTPTSAGAAYTSLGQLLRPDFGPDIGNRNGPAFGKKRRIQSATFSLYRTQQLSWGTDNSVTLRPLSMIHAAKPGAGPVKAPILFTDVIWDTISDDWGFTSQITWQQTRPYPCLIQAISGYIEGEDK